MSLIVQTVQWYANSGVGVRNYNLHGVTKVHMTVGGVKTLCGRRIPRPSKLIVPDGEYCAQCVAIKARREAQ